jgi:hypothetical protein
VLAPIYADFKRPKQLADLLRHQHQLLLPRLPTRNGNTGTEEVTKQASRNHTWRLLSFAFVWHAGFLRVVTFQQLFTTTPNYPTTVRRQSYSLPVLRYFWHSPLTKTSCAHQSLTVGGHVTESSVLYIPTCHPALPANDLRNFPDYTPIRHAAGATSILSLHRTPGHLPRPQRNFNMRINVIQLTYQLTTSTPKPSRRSL